MLRAAESRATNRAGRGIGMSTLPRALRWYLWAFFATTFLYVGCVLLGAMVLPAATGSHGLFVRHSVLLSAAVFVALCYVGERTTLNLTGSVQQSLSTSTHIAAILLLPGPYPLLVALVAVLISQAFSSRKQLYKRAFNVCHPTLTVGLSSYLWSHMAASDLVLRGGHFLQCLPYLIVLLATYYVVDVALMLGVLSLLEHRPFYLIWWQTYRLTILPELAASTIGFLAAIAWQYDATALSLVILPVVALRVAFRAISQAEERAAALHRRSEQLEVVLQAGQGMRLKHSQADLLLTVATAARTLAGASVVTGYLRDHADPTRLERLVLAPGDSDDHGPHHVAVSSVGRGIREAEGEPERTVLVPLEVEGEGVTGMLRLAGISEDFNRDDQDALAILATQATIALQNAVLHERALAQASTDGLTGLLNHRSFQTRLAEEVARAARSGQPLVVMMADLDDFRSVNNSYGHQNGDAMLMAVAGAIRESVRATDLVARYGGDEFSVILPETSLEEGMMVAERGLAAINSLRVIAGGVPVSVGASIGVAAFPLDGQTREALIQAADHAAYAAKQTGKSRVCRPEDAALAVDQDPAALAKRLEHANLATVEALAAAVDAKDAYTRGHSQRVSAYAGILAQAMDLGPGEPARVRLAGLLHDVGKIGAPDAILMKAGRLSAEEFSAIQQHSVIGERMLSQVPFLRDILPAVRHHHERWDGKGYPDGLAGDAIPRDAAILMVADSFDAMTSSRTYRAALPVAEAIRRVREGRNTQFDPSVVNAFDRAIAEGTLTVLATADTASTLPAPDVDFPDKRSRLAHEATERDRDERAAVLDRRTLDAGNVLSFQSGVHGRYPKGASQSHLDPNLLQANPDSLSKGS